MTNLPLSALIGRVFFFRFFFLLYGLFSQTPFPHGRFLPVVEVKFYLKDEPVLAFLLFIGSLL